jgi:hypothetical protein
MEGGHSHEHPYFDLRLKLCTNIRRLTSFLVDVALYYRLTETTLGLALVLL